MRWLPESVLSYVIWHTVYVVCWHTPNRARSLVLKAEGSNHCCELAATQKLWPSPPRPSACCTLRFCCTLHLYVARCMSSAARPSVTRCLRSCNSACSSTRIRWVADYDAFRCKSGALYLLIHFVLGLLMLHAAAWVVLRLTRERISATWAKPRHAHRSYGTEDGPVRLPQ